MAGFNPIKKGYDPRTESANGSGNNGEWLTIKANESVDVVVLVDKNDIIKADQCAIWLEDGNSPVWVYTGESDPSHALKIEKRYRAYLPVLVGDEPKVWSMGKQSHAMILEIADASGTLKGTVLRIKRTGERLNTKYTIVPMGKRKDVSHVDEVDVISMLGPLDTDEIEMMLAKRFGYDDYDSFISSYTPPKGKGKGSSKSKVADEVEELELS